MNRAGSSNLFLGVLLVIVWLCVIIWRDSSHAQAVHVEGLPEVPSATAQNFILSSDSAFVYRLLLVWLQQFDVQSGQYVSYNSLDYSHLSKWLDRLQQISPDSHYPMLLATRVYTRVADDKRKRQMLDFVYQQYQQNPGKNWRWLAEATVFARHSLKDLPLALDYAETLAQSANPDIPYWVRDLRLTLLEDMGEYKQVELLVGGLLANKAITDPNELRFLNLLLQRLQKNNN